MEETEIVSFICAYIENRKKKKKHMQTLFQKLLNISNALIVFIFINCDGKLILQVHDVGVLEAVGGNPELK